LRDKTYCKIVHFNSSLTYFIKAIFIHDYIISIANIF
jgi:hypothetical protein